MGELRPADNFSDAYNALSLDNKEGIAESCLELANLHYLKGEYKDAERLCKESHKIFDDLEDMGGIACTLHLIGMINQETGRYDDAFGNYNASWRFQKNSEIKLTSHIHFMKLAAFSSRMEIMKRH